MANLHKNIIINPNRGSATLRPNVVFTGNNNVAISFNITDDGVISVENVTGQLFSISNNISSGHIFSVNDISGIPHMRIAANGSVDFNEYAGNVRFSSNLYNSKLDVFSNVLVSSDIFEFRSPRGISFPAGTVAQRSNKAGVMRFNTDYNFLEYTNDGVAWANVGSGSGSGGGSPWIEDAIKNVYLNNTAANVSIGGITSKSNLEVRGNVFVLSNLAVGSNVFIGGGPSLVDFGLSIQVASGIQQSWNTNLTGATRRTWGVKTETNAGDWSILTSTAANTKPSVARLTIDTSGRLGLGIVVPTSNLHIVGNAYVSTDLFIAGNSTFTGNVVSSSNVVGQQLLATNGLILNANTLIANYTVAAGYNAVTVGPFVIPAAMNVTVAAASRWVIL